MALRQFRRLRDSRYDALEKPRRRQRLARPLGAGTFVHRGRQCRELQPHAAVVFEQRDVPGMAAACGSTGDHITEVHHILPAQDPGRDRTRQVTGAVEKKWHLYVKLGKDSINYGRVRFRFYVDRRGTPQDLKILSDARDADPRMRELTLRAILDAKIPPIPDDLLPTLFDERVKIEYEAIVY